MMDCAQQAFETIKLPDDAQAVFDVFLALPPDVRARMATLDPRDVANSIADALDCRSTDATPVPGRFAVVRLPDGRHAFASAHQGRWQVWAGEGNLFIAAQRRVVAAWEFSQCPPQ
jgi:hypothetical protein